MVAHRRARAAVRRRHLHAHRLRVARRGRQPRGEALLRRGRGFLAQAIRDLGPARGAAAGADCLVDHRPEGGRALHAAGVPRHAGQHAAGELARKIGLDEATFVRTVEDYNAACHVGRFDHTALDDCHTEGLAPAKTHWARPIDTAPFYAYPVRPGITFTYLGLKVDETAAVRFGGRASPNLFVAGEMMAGNVLGKGYTAGVGMSIGTAFGRIAGTQAANAAKNLSKNPRRPPLQQLTDLVARARADADGIGGGATSRVIPIQPRPSVDSERRRSRPHPADLQRLPLLRRLLRRLPGHDAPARIRQGRHALPRQPVPQLRRLPARLPVRAAARVRGERAAGDGAGARADVSRLRLAACHGCAVPARRASRLRSLWPVGSRSSWCWQWRCRARCCTSRSRAISTRSFRTTFSRWCSARCFSS